MRYLLSLCLFFCFQSTFASGDFSTGNNAKSGYSQLKLDNGLSSFTYYEEYTPKSNFTGETILLIPGFSKTTEYFYDFIEKAGLLKMGLRVLIVDPMLRGKSLEKNFPLIQNGDDYSFELSDEYIAKGFLNPTAEEESRRIYHLVKKLGYKSLHVLGHSRGALIAANLSEKLSMDKKITLHSLHDLNGFVNYVSYKTPSNFDLKHSPEELSRQFISLGSWLEADVSTGNTELDILRDKILAKDKLTESEMYKLTDHFSKVLTKLAFLEHLALSTPENFFIDSLMNHSEEDIRTGKIQIQNDSHRSAYLDRDKTSFVSMLNAQRLIVPVEGNLWVPSRELVFPVSSLRHYPNINADIYVYAGEKDELVSPDISLLKKHSGAENLVFKIIPGDGHYGPDLQDTVKAVRQSIKKALPKGKACRESAKN